jgi:uroporphyrin-III C-methyltransferase/precorrin-2 dehydrogenase/sirohydrochlorin ferrochelatase
MNGMDTEADQIMTRALASANTPQGMVSLVGAGPGDPDLLTLRALRILQSADVIIYDRLVSPGILDLARRDAERIYAGKARSHHSIPQDEINLLLQEKAMQGLHVVRLKGGDPFIFGRGGEEIEALASAGIPFQIVPGITAASGCSAYAGIPLTHRDYAHTCLLVAGHLKDGRLDGIHWEQLAQPCQTVVIYMGLGGLEQLCEGLIRHGAPPDRPAALVNRGTTREQEVFASDLAHLPGMVRDREAQGPALLIVGDVVKLHPDLKWFGG